ncbi:GDSL-type esterase/lipase family protein [Legionella sp. WA2024007413]
MRFIQIFSALGLMALACLPTPLHAISAAEVKQLYEEATLTFDNVFIGDSITFLGLWPELLNHRTIGNRGIGGDTTNGLYERMGNILTTNPKRVFIMIGLNDAYQDRTPVDYMFLNYKKIVDLLINNNINVVITSTVICNQVLSEKCRNALPKINELNKRLQSLTQDYRIPYLDLNSLLSGKNGLDEKFTSDGVHLNLNAYKIWAGLVAPYIL